MAENTLHLLDVSSKIDYRLLRDNLVSSRIASQLRFYCGELAGDSESQGVFNSCVTADSKSSLDIDEDQEELSMLLLMNICSVGYNVTLPTSMAGLLSWGDLQNTLMGSYLGIGQGNKSVISTDKLFSAT